SPPINRVYTRLTLAVQMLLSVIRQPISSRTKHRSPSSSTYTCGPSADERNRTGCAYVRTLGRSKNTKISVLQVVSTHSGTSSRAVSTYFTFAWRPAYEGRP